MQTSWYPNATCPPIFSATFRPFSPSWRQEAGTRKIPAKRRRKTGEKSRQMGEIWGRNGRETAVAEWRWGQHPSTGRKCIWVTPRFMESIEGLSVDESRELVSQCMVPGTSPENAIVHKCKCSRSLLRLSPQV